ncbi:hypothetical protein ADUPG1_008360 [Aduncisulcus paluster]|uniref:Uncharacterized protein n=1 Tax=Aduncisulcus paluster TaxID=2918883 RepID=A0ABQ5KVS0_9EUKA|nr:hypothetical protein ADUPG1_008360 [Aduncisulcus paluster]
MFRQLQQYEKEAEALTSQVKKIQRFLTDSKDIITTKSEQIIRLRSKNAEIASSLKSRIEENKRMEEKVEKEELRLEGIRKNYHDLKTAYSQQSQEFSRAQDALSLRRRSLSEIETVCVELDTKMKGVLKHRSKTRKEIDETKKLLHSYSKKNVDLEDAMKSCLEEVHKSLAEKPALSVTLVDSVDLSEK